MNSDSAESPFLPINSSPADALSLAIQHRLAESFTCEGYIHVIVWKLHYYPEITIQYRLLQVIELWFS